MTPPPSFKRIGDIARKLQRRLDEEERKQDRARNLTPPKPGYGGGQ